MTTDPNKKIDQLYEKLESLLKRQDDFSKEINNIRLELNSLKTTAPVQKLEPAPMAPAKPIIQPEHFIRNEPIPPVYPKIEQEDKPERFEQTGAFTKKPPKVKSDLEKFIGENLINKIGIVITVIGVAIGAKYSIENNLINPLTRIILGYLFGLGLLGVGIKLKRNYENYSAVLVSGAMAIMYFITFTAYSLYGIIPQMMAFVLMVIFTVFTVVAAINYNKQIIAHIGLVGAYAVPFLLSDGSGKVAALFTYMAMLNTGILAIAFKKYWKSLYY